MNAHAAASRRQLLQGMGALVVIMTAPAEALAAAATAPGGLPHPAELDSWIAIAADGKVTAFFGKPDVGQGVEVAIAQIVAEELDVPLDHVSIVQADTARTCDQGGVSGSTGIQLGGAMLRGAAAEARRLLLEQAAVKLSVTPDKLAVRDGVVSVIGAPRRKVSYAQLIKGGRFDAKLEWNGKTGNALLATGKAKPKTPDQYRLVGTSPPRRDIPPKVHGTFAYAADHRPPGMLHGRTIHPPVAGSRPVAVDEASIARFPGAKVLRKGDFIGVVAPREWDAVQAARTLKVTWSKGPAPLFDSETLFDHIRKAPAQKREVVQNQGAVDQALKGGGLLVEAEYEWPFQSHASLGPGCAVADVRPDGVTLWNPSQKTFATAQGVAKLLGRPVESVRSIYIQGPGSYGRNDAGDACADAAVMSSLVGKPVRVQWMRADGHGWDPKGAASIHKVRAVIGADGKMAAYDYLSKGVNRMDVNTFEQDPQDFLAGPLLGFANNPAPNFGAPEDSYVVPNRRMAWETIPKLMDGASPLRTSHLRDPLGPQIHFASESFIDECAAAAKADPVAFRLAHVQAPRHRAVIEAAAKAANWKAGPPGARRSGSGQVVTGTGFAYANRGQTIVAVVSEVEVDKATGRVWPRRFWVAHECGLIVNPNTLKLVIEGNVVHGASRALFEEVKFDADNVTSTDWISYPILDVLDAPEAVDVVLLDRPDLPSSGADEPSTRPVAAAVANAIYDAVGVRLRRAPFTRQRIKAALSKA